jgi:hypothetical protein
MTAAPPPTLLEQNLQGLQDLQYAKRLLHSAADKALDELLSLL